MRTNKLWFRRKTYGWGWTPITWEGWFVTLLVVVIPIVIRLTLKALEFEKSTQYFYAWASVPILVMALTLICFRYGEKPKWQWGVKRTKLANLNLAASNYKESVRFYDLVLLSLGWEKIISRTDHTSYTDGTLKIILSPVLMETKPASPKQVAFYAETKEIVDDFNREILQKNNIETVGKEGAKGDKNYYSVQFYGPDKVILEVAYSPFYCDKEFAQNNLENNFNPYES